MLIGEELTLSIQLDSVSKQQIIFTVNILLLFNKQSLLANI